MFMCCTICFMCCIICCTAHVSGLHCMLYVLHHMLSNSCFCVALHVLCVALHVLCIALYVSHLMCYGGVSLMCVLQFTLTHVNVQSIYVLHTYSLHYYKHIILQCFLFVAARVCITNNTCVCISNTDACTRTCSSQYVDACTRGKFWHK